MKNDHLADINKGFRRQNNLNYLILIFVFAFLSYGAWANPPLASKQQIGMFKNSTLCVVLDEASIAYNVLVKDAVEKYWKATDFVFIGQEEFNQRHFDSKYSFLVLMKGVYDKDPGGISYNYLSLVLGDKSTDLTNMPEICSLPVSYSNDFSIEYGYLIPFMVKFMQKHAVNLETKRFVISLRGLKYYNGKSIFKDKVLLLNEKSLALNADTPGEIKEAYSWYVKILSIDKIKEEIENDPPNALVNLHVGPGNDNGSGKCFEMIFDVYGNLYYYNSRNITNDNRDGFNLKDFRRL